MIIFRLTMAKVPTWNGTWSGADKVFVRRRLDSVVPASVVGRVFTYEWDDGWSVRISVEKVSAVEAIGIAKQSKGFCGYDWMIDSIIKYGEILDERARAKKDGYFFYNGEYLSPEDVAVRLTEYKDKIAELSQAVGLITTLKPTMVMDVDRPLDMAKEVTEYVTARIAELEAKVAEQKAFSQYQHLWQQGEDAEERAYFERLVPVLKSRIAELEGFIGQLIKAGNAMSNAQSMWVAEEDKWDALVKDWKERER